MKDPIYFYIIQFIILIVFLLYFTYTTYDLINSLNNISTKISLENNNQTWIPAITICSDNVDYNIYCKSYGEQCNSSDYTFSKYIGENMTEILEGYDGYMNTDRCFVFNNTKPLVFKPTKGINPNSVEEFIVLNFTSSSPGYWSFISIYHPLRKGNNKIGLDLLQPLFNTSIRKTVLFSYKKYIPYNGNEEYEINYNTDSYTSRELIFGFVPKNYITEIVEEYKPITIPLILSNLISLLGTLFSIFTILSGKGSYSPTGLMHNLFNYNRAEHMLSKHDYNGKKFEDVLNIYLNDIKKSLIKINDNEKELLRDEFKNS